VVESTESQFSPLNTARSEVFFRSAWIDDTSAWTFARSTPGSLAATSLALSAVRPVLSSPTVDPRAVYWVSMVAPPRPRASDTAESAALSDRMVVAIDQ
jgi:hypothetical protein